MTRPPGTGGAYAPRREALQQAARLIVETPGLTCPDMAARIGFPLTDKRRRRLLDASLRRLALLGLVNRYRRRRLGHGSPTVYEYFATGLLKQYVRGGGLPAEVGVKTDERIVALLRDGPARVKELAERLGHTPRAIRYAVQRLASRGLVVVHEERGGWLVRLPEDELEDDDWQPQPWVSSIRARALGLRAA